MVMGWWYDGHNSNRQTTNLGRFVNDDAENKSTIANTLATAMWSGFKPHMLSYMYCMHRIATAFCTAFQLRFALHYNCVWHCITTAFDTALQLRFALSFNCSLLVVTAIDISVA